MRPTKDEIGTGDDILRLALPLFNRTSSLACRLIVMGFGILFWAFFLGSPLLLIHEVLSLLW